MPHHEGKRVLITVSNLKITSGVSTFWNSLLKSFQKYDDLTITPLEIGGHGKNILGPLKDQWRFHRSLRHRYDLVILNPSLTPRAFFRDTTFARQLVAGGHPFAIFFHGWEKSMERRIDQHHTKLFMKTFGQARQIFVLSPEFEEKLRGWGYEGEITVETTNVDPSLAEGYTLEERQAELADASSFQILFLARLLKEKGVFELIDAFKTVRQKHPHARLVIAGDGKDFHRLEEAIGEEEGFTITGDVRGEEKIRLFRESHLYVLPSYTEGLPISVLEAMLFGLPVVTTRVGGLKYFIEEGKMGYLVEPRSTGQLVDVMEQCLSSREHLAEMSQYNYHYARRHLTSDEMASRLYDRIMALVDSSR